VFNNSIDGQRTPGHIRDVTKFASKTLLIQLDTVNDEAEIS